MRLGGAPGVVPAVGERGLAKSPRDSECVTVKHEGRSGEALIVYPELKDKPPVVLIIHEISGLHGWAQELVDEFAAAGFIAVAPDSLSGMVPNTRVHERLSDRHCDRGHWQAQSGPSDSRFQCRSRLWDQFVGLQRETVRGRFLLGRWSELRVLQQIATIFWPPSYSTGGRPLRTQCWV
jgi:hypothetical protein